MRRPSDKIRSHYAHPADYGPVRVVARGPSGRCHFHSTGCTRSVRGRLCNVRLPRGPRCFPPTRWSPARAVPAKRSLRAEAADGSCWVIARVADPRRQRVGGTGAIAFTRVYRRVFVPCAVLLLIQTRVAASGLQPSGRRAGAAPNRGRTCASHRYAKRQSVRQVGRRCLLCV